MGEKNIIKCIYMYILLNVITLFYSKLRAKLGLKPLDLNESKKGKNLMVVTSKCCFTLLLKSLGMVRFYFFIYLFYFLGSNAIYCNAVLLKLTFPNTAHEGRAKFLTSEIHSTIPLPVGRGSRFPLYTAQQTMRNKAEICPGTKKEPYNSEIGSDSEEICTVYAQLNILLS